jgi:hypothetical protein
MDFRTLKEKFGVIHKLEETSSRGQYKMECPVCLDGKQKLYVSEPNGKLLLDCKKGCSFSDILEGFGETVSDSEGWGDASWVNDFMKESMPTPVAVYEYLDELGRKSYAKRKFVNGEKKFFDWVYFNEGQYRVLPSTKNPKFGRLPAHIRKLPYNLPALLKANTTQPIFMVEGEKCVEYLSSKNAVTADYREWHEEWNYLLKNKDVIILPDNDRTGDEKVAKTVKAINGSAKSVRVVNLPSLDVGEDIVDWFEKYAGTVGELRRLIKQAPQSACEKLQVLRVFDGRPAPKSWVFDHFIRATDKTTTCLIHAREKTGKSWYVYGMALSLATGRLFMNEFRPNAAFQRVLIVSPEGGIGLVKERMWAMASDFSEEELQRANDNLLYLDLSTSSINFNNSSHLLQIKELVQKHNISSIIFDPLIEFAGVDENDNAEMSRILTSLRSLGVENRALFLVITHHNAKQGGEARGASSILGKYDFKVSMQRKTETASSVMLSFSSRNSIPIVSRKMEICHDTDINGDTVEMFFEEYKDDGSVETTEETIRRIAFKFPTGKTLTTEEVNEIIGGRAETRVNTRNELVKLGVLKEVKNGKKKLFTLNTDMEDLDE